MTPKYFDLEVLRAWARSSSILQKKHLPTAAQHDSPALHIPTLLESTKMAANAPLPPSKLLSDRVVSLSEAHDFLTKFIAKIDDERHVTNTDLVLADQRRIAQALKGVYVPKPEPTPDHRDDMGDEEGKAADGAAEVQDTEMGGMDAEPPTKAQSTAVTAGGVDKAKRKADKKARQLEEKRKRAEALAKEKANQD